MKVACDNEIRSWNTAKLYEIEIIERGEVKTKVGSETT